MRSDNKRQLKKIVSQLNQGNVDSERLFKLADSLEEHQEKDVTPDDIEWLRLLAQLQAQVNKCVSASDFGWLEGNHREWPFSYEKADLLYKRMKKTGAIERLDFFIGGTASVLAVDLRDVKKFILMQTKQRFRAMEFMSPKSGKRGKLLIDWMIRHATAIVVTVVATVTATVVITFFDLNT